MTSTMCSTNQFLFAPFPLKCLWCFDLPGCWHETQSHIINKYRLLLLPLSQANKIPGWQGLVPQSELSRNIYLLEVTHRRQRLGRLSQWAKVLEVPPHIILSVIKCIISGSYTSAQRVECTPFSLVNLKDNIANGPCCIVSNNLSICQWLKKKVTKFTSWL